MKTEKEKPKGFELPPDTPSPNYESKINRDELAKKILNNTTKK